MRNFIARKTFYKFLFSFLFFIFFSHGVLANEVLSPELVSNEESLTEVRTEVKIGVLAKDGIEKTHQQWNATADYLTENVEGNYEFVIVPLGFDQISAVVERDEVDFLITNSGIYVDLETKFHLSRIVTLKKGRAGSGNVQFGGVIFARANYFDINYITDINLDTKIAAVAENSLGGYLSQLGELKKTELDLDDLAKKIVFLNSHKNVIDAVLDANFEVGFVRTDLIETLVEEGELELNQIKILIGDNESEQHLHSASNIFPFVHNTNLYPEWPFSKLSATSSDLSEKVAVELIKMDRDDQAAKSSGATGWTTPLNYQSVHELLKSVKAPPYEHYGEIDLADFIKEYLYFIIIVLILLILLVISLIYLSVLNIKNKRVEKEINKLNNALKIITKILRHDLANVFTAVKYAGELFLETKDSRMMKDGIEKVEEGLDLINQMKEVEVSLTKSDDYEMVELSPLIKAVAEKFSIEIKITGDAKACADKSLESVFSNLFSNAINHGKTEKIDILIQDGSKFATVDVTDYGKGIPKKIRSKIFEEGFKYGETGNTGLGLYIVDQTLKRYGGTVSLKDGESSGATFVLKLPKKIKKF